MCLYTNNNNNNTKSPCHQVYYYATQYIAEVCRGELQTERSTFPFIAIIFASDCVWELIRCNIYNKVLLLLTCTPRLSTCRIISDGPSSFLNLNQFLYVHKVLSVTPIMSLDGWDGIRPLRGGCVGFVSRNIKSVVAFWEISLND